METQRIGLIKLFGVFYHVIYMETETASDVPVMMLQVFILFLLISSVTNCCYLFPLKECTYFLLHFLKCPYNIYLQKNFLKDRHIFNAWYSYSTNT